MFGVKLEVACSVLCSHEFVIKDYRYFERYRKIFQHFIRHVDVLLMCTIPVCKNEALPLEKCHDF